MNILVGAGHIGVVSTDDNAEDGYCIYIYIRVVHTKCKTKILFMYRS